MPASAWHVLEAAATQAGLRQASMASRLSSTSLGALLLGDLSLFKSS